MILPLVGLTGSDRLVYGWAARRKGSRLSPVTLFIRLAGNGQNTANRIT